MTNSSPWKDPPFWSSVNHLFLWAIFFPWRTVSHNQWVICPHDIPSRVICYITIETTTFMVDFPIENGRFTTFMVDLPIENGDFPVRFGPWFPSRSDRCWWFLGLHRARGAIDRGDAIEGFQCSGRILLEKFIKTTMVLNRNQWQ